MTSEELKKKLMDAGITDERVLANVIFNLPTPEQIDEEMLNAYLQTGGASELTDAAIRSDFFNSKGQPGKTLIDALEGLEVKEK